MRPIFVAGIFLSSVLLNAQTVTKAQSAMLVARNEATPAATVGAATDIPTTSSGRRVSTGVIAPKLIGGPVVKVATTDFPTEDLASQHVVVGFRVDPSGVPTNVHVVKSVNQSVDQKVMAAILQSRFTPATLDDQAVPMDINLVVSFQTR